MSQRNICTRWPSLTRIVHPDAFDTACNLTMGVEPIISVHDPRIFRFDTPWVRFARSIAHANAAPMAADDTTTPAIGHHDEADTRAFGLISAISAQVNRMKSLPDVKVSFKLLFCDGKAPAQAWPRSSSNGPFWTPNSHPPRVFMAVWGAELGYFLPFPQILTPPAKFRTPRVFSLARPAALLGC